MHLLWILNGCGLENSVTGGPVRFHEVAKRWRKIAPELEQELMTTSGGAALCDDLGSQIKRVIVPASLILKREPSRLFRFWSYLVTSLFFRRGAASVAAPDIVITVSDYFCDIIPALYFKKRYGAGWTAWIHHREVRNRPGNKLVNAITFRMQEWSFGKIARYADEAWTYSTDSGDVVEARLCELGMKRDKIRRMECGIDIEAIKNAEEPSEKKYDAVMVGLRPNKGIYDLLPVWERVLALRPQTTIRLLGGKSGADDVYARIKASPVLSKAVFFDDGSGYLEKDEYYKALKEARIFFAPSHEEGWGIAVCEAMAAGLPVVAYDLSVYRRIYGGSIVTVPCFDIDRMAEKIVSVLNDEAMMDKYRESGIAASSKYGWDEIAARDYDALLQSPLKSITSALVLGAGRSGKAAMALLEKHGVCAVLADGEDDLPAGHFDIAVTSPGIPPQHRWFAECANRKIDVISELELGASLWPGEIIAVTGSKGKSSLVKLISDGCVSAGHSALPCGNYGTPLCELLLTESPPEFAVLEVSSFQLERIRSFHPGRAVFLNLQSDHLDRHGSMASYAGVKSRVFEHFNPDTDLAIFEAQALADAVKLGAPAAIRLTENKSADIGGLKIFGNIDASADYSRLLPKEGYFSAELLAPAAYAAIIIFKSLGFAESVIVRAFGEFEPLKHRMEVVAEKDGIIYVDNSKATSLASVSASLEMLQRPCRLIAGGRLKEDNLDQIIKVLEKFSKKVYLIGESSSRLYDAWSSFLPCEICGNIGNAVKTAMNEAKPGEAVLLAPGCASFDQFNNYKERGGAFKNEVLNNL